MSTKTCPICGNAIPADKVAGHCPRCLLNLGRNLGTETETRTSPSQSVLKTSIFEPQIFGDYEILEQIGRGGMGVVYRARQRSLNRIVALKMISNVDSASPVVLARFRLEAEAAAKLEHDHIVSTYEFGEWNGQPYLTLRLIEGTNLGNRMPELTLKRFAEAWTSAPPSKSTLRDAQEKIASLVAAIARAVHYAHQHGIIHRDLKPRNILLDREDRPYVTDFGLAKMTAEDYSLTATDDLLGTPRYMSPEQASGKRVTPSTDVYSLGTILFELLTGQSPFRGDTPSEVLRLIIEEEPPHPFFLNPHVDKNLATICLKCLEKDPLRRYGSAADLADDLDRWLRHESICARRASPAERLIGWTRRKPAQASILALLLAVSALSTFSAFQFARLGEQRKVAATQASNALTVLRRELMTDLASLWTNSSQHVVQISSEKMASLRGVAPITADAQGDVSELIFAVYTHQEPGKMLNMLSPVLGELERYLVHEAKNPRKIHLRIYRKYNEAQDALAKGEIDFARVGPSSYVAAKDRNSKVSLILAQNGRVQGCIVVRTNSDIQSLGDLKGKSMAFVDPSSTTGNDLPKMALVVAGLTAKDLKGGGSNYLRAHDAVAEKVASGEFDAGALNASVVRDFEKRTGIALKFLMLFPNESKGLPWVTSGRLDRKTVSDIRAGLYSIRDKAMLKALGNDTSGFVEALDSDYDRLREEIKISERFDTDSKPSKQE